MTRLRSAACALLSAACAATSALAQADAPHPDFTGVWMPTSRAPDGARLTVPPVAEKFLPEVARAYEAHQENYVPEVDESGRNCFAYGMPRHMFMTAQYPAEIIETPGQVTMIFEVHNDVRRIYTDGREHPTDLRPTMFGHSVGRWEGDTLVVDTVGVRDREFPDPRSTDVHITERLRLVDAGERGALLEDAISVEDPNVFAEPYERTVYFRKVPDGQMQEYFCSEDLWFQAYTGQSVSLPWR